MRPSEAVGSTTAHAQGLKSLREAHARCVARAEALSGTALDARQRAEHYHALYEASGGSFMFPLVATHGSLWGVSHTQRLGRALSRVRPLSRHGRIQRWIDALTMVADINRRVFVEIHSTFHFTREHGRHPLADRVVDARILRRYNEVHAAVAAGSRLGLEARRDVYFDVFVHEQEHIVDPGIHEAARASGSAWLVRVLRHVRPRFTYFPPGERLRFTDFTDVEQRNREGLRALAFAEAVGPERVRAAMEDYVL